MTKLKILGAVLIVAVAAAFAVACGDDNGDGNGEEPEATEMMDATEAPSDGEDPGDGEQPSGGGSGTLTIGDETWTLVDIIFCGFSPEETENARVSFTMVGTGERASDGERSNLDVTIQDTQEEGRYSGDGTIQSITIGTWEGTTGFVGGPAWEIQVDGNEVSADATFDDTSTEGELEEVAGTLTATCP